MSYDTYDSGSYRIRRGWHPVPDLDASYEITAWPKQYDQGRLRWFKPIDAGVEHIYHQYQEVVQSLGGSGQAQGEPTFTWRLGGLTPGMAHYVANTVFAGSANDRFTTMTWDRYSHWHVDWVYGTIGPLRDAAEIGYRRGLRYLDINFIVIQAAPAE